MTSATRDLAVLIAREIDTLPKENALHGMARGSESAGATMLLRLPNRYRGLARIGTGGMSQIFSAWDDQAAHRVALKLLHPELADDPAIVKRFLNEAYALRGLRHPGIVSIFDWGLIDGNTAYLSIELLDESLRDLLLRCSGRLSESEAVSTIAQVADALTYVHEAGLVHRDLKPGNVMFKLSHGFRQTKLLDFGLAKIPEDQQGPETPVNTHDSLMPGTPEYMAPEQWQCAATVNGQADVYSLGIMLYELLAGLPPFIADDPVDLMGLHLYETPLPIGRLVNVAAPLQDLLQQMLAKDASERPPMSQVALRLALLTGTQ